MKGGGGGGGDIVLKQCGARRPCRWYLVLASTTSIDALAPTLNLHPPPSLPSPWLDSRLERMDKEDDVACINGHLAAGLKPPLGSLSRHTVGRGFLPSDETDPLYEGRYKTKSDFWNGCLR